MSSKPTAAFIFASYSALSTGIVAYSVGVWNSTMLPSEKGFYITILMYALFSAVSVQKSVRDRNEGIPVTDLYYGICWLSTFFCLVLLTVGLWNASWAMSEKGFYAMAFLLSMFAAIAVQKNTRDLTIGRRSSLGDPGVGRLPKG